MIRTVPTQTLPKLFPTSQISLFEQTSTVCSTSEPCRIWNDIADRDKAYENGRSSLLLNVAGTLPVSFRGTTYMFPISLWVPHEYPRGVPMTFVTPTKNIAIRPGQYVSGEGRIYHPYLAGWREDVSFPTHEDAQCISRNLLSHGRQVFKEGG